jgi:SAM-dependent methyltransferase
MSVTGRSARPSGAEALWERLFALAYDPFIWLAELAGMRERRARLAAQARGRTVELGSGTGLNLSHYPAEVGELILTEPDPAMRLRLEHRARRADRSVRVLADSAEALSMADGSVDTVVSTLVLCTVDDPGRALDEIARVLRPDGQLLFIEHVRAESARLAGWQDRLERPWRRFAVGCHCNRSTLRAIRDAGFTADAETARWRGMPPIVAPLISGTARLAGSAPAQT